MDRIFESVATLMSNLLITIVENSLLDLVEMIEEYGTGNQ